MGPGRKPRKEPSATYEDIAATSRFNGAWAKTQEGTILPQLLIDTSSELQWGLGENPGRNRARRTVLGTIGYELQWGLGENPGRNCAPGDRS